MIKRTRYSKEFRDAIRNKIVLAQSTLSQVSKRENIASQTLHKTILIYVERSTIPTRT